MGFDPGDHIRRSSSGRNGSARRRPRLADERTDWHLPVGLYADVHGHEGEFRQATPSRAVGSATMNTARCGSAPLTDYRAPFKFTF